MVIVDCEREELAWEAVGSYNASDGIRGVSDGREENSQQKTSEASSRRSLQRRSGGRLVYELQHPAKGQSYDDWWDSLAEQTERIIEQTKRRRQRLEQQEQLAANQLT